MIGKMRNRLTCKVWATSKEPGGGVTKSLSYSFHVWGQVDARNGFIQTGKDQRQWPYDYKVTVRFDERIKENVTIEHDGKSLQINSMQIQDEGKKKFLILRCSTNG